MELADILSDRLQLYYCRSVSTKSLTPALTLEQSLAEVNQTLDRLGRSISTWPDYLADQAANLVRVNWFYQHLAQEPIRKPLLVDAQGKVLCGDTRLMTLSLLDQSSQVSAVAVGYPDFCDAAQQLHSSADLIAVCGFDTASAQVIYSLTDQQLDWLEIGDSTTAHHLHNLPQRICMLETYLRSRSLDFKFTRNWIKTKIDWHGLLGTVSKDTD